MGEISFRETSGLEVVWGTFFPVTKGPFGGFLLPETDPLGPAGARVLTMVYYRTVGVTPNH